MGVVMYKQKEFANKKLDWSLIGWVVLSIRFVQGWIFWGGGSRRFIYDPQKLDPYAPQWMANKFQSAMPGALFDLSSVVSFLLNHFVLLYISIIVFSLLELLSGLGLIFGLFTRGAAMITVAISLILMVLFGWQGATCLDEWTMAVSNLSMGLTLVLTGGSIYSLDALLIKRYPALAQKTWFVLFSSGVWSFNRLRKVALIFYIFTIFFTVGTYDYYRGAVFSRYHAGPVSPYKFHLSLSDGRLTTNGSIYFTLYVDSGPSAVPTYIVRIELLDPDKKIIETWDIPKLRALPQTAIENKYQYNKVEIGSYGLIAPESSKAKISITPSMPLTLPQGNYLLQIHTVDGTMWSLRINI